MGGLRVAWWDGDGWDGWDGEGGWRKGLLPQPPGQQVRDPLTHLGWREVELAPLAALPLASLATG